jgi:hypothetical protein
MTLNASYRRILQKMGYYEYQRGLIYHHLNQEGGWNSHLEKCRHFILKSFNHIKPHVVTVLGSGWLLDFPLREISENASAVYLVDIVHPPELRKQVSGMGNVLLREEDITGGLISEIWEKAGSRYFFNKIRSLGEIKIPDYQPDYEPGMVVSLNILTQLESLPIRLLEKKAKVDEESLLTFRKSIQMNHIRFLLKYQSVLITDTSELITEASGKVSEKRSALIGLPEGTDMESWTWNFESKKSDFYRKKSVFNVTALFYENGPGESKKNVY